MDSRAFQTSGAPDRCVRCNAQLDSLVGCRDCHTIFPTPSNLDHFERLGLPRSFDLSRSELERKFLAWSRELHPDFFQGKPEEEQHLSLRLSAALNDAYATLKDPFRRAEYLLSLLGGPSASEQRDMPEAFLEEVLELRMAIADAKADEADSPDRSKLEERLLNDRDQALSQIAAEFRQATSDDPERLLSIRSQLNRIKYLDGLLRDLSETESWD